MSLFSSNPHPVRLNDDTFLVFEKGAMRRKTQGILGKPLCLEPITIISAHNHPDQHPCARSMVVEREGGLRLYIRDIDDDNDWGVRILNRLRPRTGFLEALREARRHWNGFAPPTPSPGFNEWGWEGEGSALWTSPWGWSLQGVREEDSKNSGSAWLTLEKSALLGAEWAHVLRRLREEALDATAPFVRVTGNAAALDLFSWLVRAAAGRGLPGYRPGENNWSARCVTPGKLEFVDALLSNPGWYVLATPQGCRSRAKTLLEWAKGSRVFPDVEETLSTASFATHPGSTVLMLDETDPACPAHPGRAGNGSWATLEASAPAWDLPEILPEDEVLRELSRRLEKGCALAWPNFQKN